MEDKNNIPNIMANLAKLCETNPDKGLEEIKIFMEKVNDQNFIFGLQVNPSSKLAKDMINFFKFCRAMAYGRKGFSAIIEDNPQIDITSATGKELREELRITEQDLDYLELALREIKEIEDNDPKFINKYIRVSEEDNLAESKIDVIAIGLERCRPGRTQEILGRTKLMYFSGDRIKLWPSLEPSDVSEIFMNIFFKLDFNVIDAMFLSKGKDKNGRKNMKCILFEKSLDLTGENLLECFKKAGNKASIHFYDDKTTDIGDWENDVIQTYVSNK